MSFFFVKAHTGWLEGSTIVSHPSLLVMFLLSSSLLVLANEDGVREYLTTSAAQSVNAEITAENLSQSTRSAGIAWAREKRSADVVGRRMAYIERGKGYQCHPSLFATPLCSWPRK